MGGREEGGEVREDCGGLAGGGGPNEGSSRLLSAVFEIDSFRRTDPWLCGEVGEPTTTFDTETEVVAGVTDGLLTLEARLGDGA